MIVHHPQRDSRAEPVSPPREQTALALAPAASPAQIRIVVADDRELVRSRLRELLQGQDGIEVLHSGADAEAADVDVQERRPDIVVLDLAAPGHTAVDAVRRLREQVPRTQIVILASNRERAWAQPLLDAGALAFVAREAVESDLTAAVTAATRGERYVSASVEPGVSPSGRGPNRDRLTPRETEVLRQIAHGFTSVEIAQALNLSPRTIETHRARIQKKLALSTRAELVRHALRRGLLQA